MAVTGKDFEERVKSDWKESFQDGFIVRIYDTVAGYMNVKNLCDFIAYAYPNIYLLECKAHAGASLPFSNITQYDRLLKLAGLQGVRSGVILYLYDKSKVYYIPIKTIEQMKKDGKKSVGLKAVEEGYKIIEIPSIKLRTFMKSDYNIMRDLEDGD